MQFFKLGKLDRSRGGAGEEASSSTAGEAQGNSSVPPLPGGGGAAGGAAVSTGYLPEPIKDKKKKLREEEGGLGGVAPGPARAQGGGLSVNDFISKTKTQQRQGLKPSGPELIAYARYLGIDPVADHDLLWIAVEALEAPLPSDWTEHFDSNDRVFYYNATTRVSSWTHPLEHVYRETYKTIVSIRNANLSAQERTEKLGHLQMEVSQMEVDVQKEIAQWTEHTDDQGNRFYFNRQERQSTWTDPRPAKCQVLYLKMKMLRLLQSSSTGTQGFADAKLDQLPGRLPASMGGGEFYDAMKRPTAGQSRLDAPRGLPSSEMGGSVAITIPLVTVVGSEGRGGRNSPGPGSPAGSARHSDSDDDDKKKKKKKKKKKHRDQELDELPSKGMLRGSKSESDVAAWPAAGGVAHGEGGTAVANCSVPYMAHGGLDEGLSTMGRARVKAGIRLEPLQRGDSIGPGSPFSHGPPEPVPAGKVMRGSASAPFM